MRIVDAYQLQEEQNGDRAWLIRCGMHCQMIGTIVNPFVFSYYGMSKLYLFILTTAKKLQPNAVWLLGQSCLCGDGCRSNKQWQSTCLTSGQCVCTTRASSIAVAPFGVGGGGGTCFVQMKKGRCSSWLNDEESTIQ